MKRRKLIPYAGKEIDRRFGKQPPISSRSTPYAIAKNRAQELLAKMLVDELTEVARQLSALERQKQELNSRLNEVRKE